MVIYFVRKHAANLVFRSDESKGTFRLQSGTVCELQSILFCKTVKHGHSGKVKRHTSCVTAKLQTNCKISFNEVGTKHFCKISFKEFEN